MGKRPKLVTFRSKKEADEFLGYEIEQGNTYAKKYPLPEELSGQTARVEFVFGSRKYKKFVVSFEDPKTHELKFYHVHNSAVGFKHYDEPEDIGGYGEKRIWKEKKK